MARTINDIQQDGLDAITASAELNALEILTNNEQASLQNLTSQSKVSQWRLFLWVTAFMIWTSEKLMDIERADIEQRIAETRPFTRSWYVATSLLYQHGYELPEFGIYDLPTTPQEEQAIAASKIVNKASVVQAIISGVGSLRIKVATLINGELEPLTSQQLNGFQQYIELMGAAGVYVIATSTVADDLKLEIDIHFNALILDNEGKRLDGTNDTPVQNAITNYLKSVDFDGQLNLVKLTNVLESVEGVEDPFITLAASKYAGFSYDTPNVSNVGTFSKFRQPDSGYFKLDNAVSLFNFIES
ncbi:MAG: hypothetical protein WA775_03095 [Psychroserpens sp.]|uniref:hypothetical protein n=1 Tax=Psychroserpens sp. TaxID=2020870 RepID=UPI003CA90D34